MPQIIVIADQAADTDAPVMFRERVTVSDFESEHFTAQLAERLAWAVGDAHEFERHVRRPGRRRFQRSVSVDAGAEPVADCTAADTPGAVTSSTQRAPRSASVVTTAS